MRAREPVVAFCPQRAIVPPDRVARKQRMAGATSLWEIFKGFLIVGATAYGGPAMMPQMRREVAEKRGFVSPEEFNLALGLCQTIPGGTLMQLAAYIGLTLRGLRGALAAYLGFSLPAFVCITFLAVFYNSTRSLPVAQSVYSGLKVLVLAICLTSCLDFIKRLSPTTRHKLFTAGAAALFLAGAGVVPIVLAAAVLGMFFLDAGPDPAVCSLAPEAANRQDTRGALRLAIFMAMTQVACLVFLFFWDRLLFDLAVSMIKVDMLAFGGFGIFPVLYAEVVEHHAWISEASFIEAMALAQVTPGPSLLAAAFIGFMVRGLSGAVVASIGIFAASFVVVLAACHWRRHILCSRRARQALAGVLATLGGMIVAVCWTLSKAISWGWPSAALLAASLAALAAKVPIYWIVPAAALASLALYA